MNENTATQEAPAVAEVETAEQGEMFVLFDPARLPARDEGGFLNHPDLAQMRLEDGRIDPALIVAAGFEIEIQMRDEALRHESISTWTPPTRPSWQLVQIKELLEGDALALYVRPIKPAAPVLLFDPSRLPERDADGTVIHPDFELYEAEDGAVMTSKFAAADWENRGVLASEQREFCYDDETAEVESETGCFALWQPTPPDGDGWLLAAIYETENGPQAMFARPIPQPAGDVTAPDNEGDRPLPAVAEDAFDDELEDYTPGLVDIRANAMAGDLVKFLIAEFRAARKPWQQMSEGDQRDQIDRARKRVEEAVTQVCSAIASEGRPSIQAMLEQVVVKDGIKATLSLSRMDERRHDLMDAQGREVLIVVSGARGFLTGEMPKPEPAQRRLKLKEAKRATDELADKPVADNCPAVQG